MVELWKNLGLHLYTSAVVCYTNTGAPEHACMHFTCVFKIGKSASFLDTTDPHGRCTIRHIHCEVILSNNCRSIRCSPCSSHRLKLQIQMLEMVVDLWITVRGFHWLVHGWKNIKSPKRRQHRNLKPLGNN